MKNNFKLLLQYIAPHHLISRFIFYITRIENPWFKNWSINRFIRKYGVNMSEAQLERAEDYRHFNSFFTRRLKADVRPDQTSDRQAMYPVDGAICDLGRISGGRIIQAKDHDFSLHALLGGVPEITEAFVDGEFCNIYLAPKDYHCVHMPMDGKLEEMIYVPGRLFSVSPFTAERIPGLFARNERVVLIFSTPDGPMALVLVGAMCVSAIDIAWHGLVTPRFDKEPSHWDYAEKEMYFSKGDYIGGFHMGSTVIMCMAKDTIAWTEKAEQESVKLGEVMGEMQITPSEPGALLN